MSDLHKESADISRLNNKITAQTEKIELLQAQIAALREALEKIVDNEDQFSMAWASSLARDDISSTVITSRKPTELPDNMRVPLHSLVADIKYIIARIRTADDEEALLLEESIRIRLSHIEEAAYHLIYKNLPQVCIACGKPWDGVKCGQAENDHPFPVCTPTPIVSDPNPNHATKLLRQCYITLAFAFQRLHQSSRSRDSELCLDFQKVRSQIEKHFKKIEVKL